MELHSDEAIERAVLTLREMTQERRSRGISAVMMLEEQIKALRKDAERYRWLRAEVAAQREIAHHFLPVQTPSDLDARIDAEVSADATVGDA